MFLQEKDILSIKEGSLLIDTETERLYLVEKVCQYCIYFRFHSFGISEKRSESKRWKTHIITYSIGNSYRIVPVSVFRRELGKKIKRVHNLEVTY